MDIEARPAAKSGIEEKEGGETEENMQTEQLCTERALITIGQAHTEQEEASDEEQEELPSPTEKLRQEGQLRVRLERLITIGKGYKTLFEGLKLNTERNSAITTPILFLSQRIVYALVVVLLSTLTSEVACIILIIVSMTVLIFTVVERPWKHDRENKLAIFNEFGFYTLLLFLFALSCQRSVDKVANEAFGWASICLVMALVHVNLTLMLGEAWQHAKLVYIRLKTLKRYRSIRNKVGPFPRKDDEPFVEQNSSGPADANDKNNKAVIKVSLGLDNSDRDEQVEGKDEDDDDDDKGYFEPDNMSFFSNEKSESERNNRQSSHPDAILNADDERTAKTKKAKREKGERGEDGVGDDGIMLEKTLTRKTP